MKVFFSFFGGGEGNTNELFLIADGDAILDSIVYVC